MRTCAGLSCVLVLAGLIASTAAAPPKGKPAANSKSAALPKVEADVLPPGAFAGVLVSTPNSDRMITLKITYGEVRLKPGAKMPNFRSMEARTMHQIMQEMNRAQQMPRGGGNRGGYHHHHANAAANMMQMEQRYMQQQQHVAQAMARAQQQELRLLQQEIQAIQKMYQVVPVTREFDFQLHEKAKVRIKDLPEQFDEKGNIKKYTREELAELKGKDKNLMGYERSLEDLQPGQTVLVALRLHKKPKPNTLATSTAKKDKEEEKVEKESDSTVEHKTQVTVLVILKDGNAPQSSTSRGNGKKNKK